MAAPQSSREAKWPFIVNLANSIIGVSILAMPYSFQQCGVVLTTLLLLASNLLTRLSCYLLMHGSFISSSRSYEQLAMRAYGTVGRTCIEVVSIAYLLSTLVAFHVIIGDLGPDILPQALSTLFDPYLSPRTIVMVLFMNCIILPLCLLRNVESLSSASGLAVLFYGIIIVRLLVYALPNILVFPSLPLQMWEPSAILRVFSICIMSFSCQTSLFVIAASLPESSISRVDDVTTRALNLCCSAYIALGLLGYITFHSESISGDILLHFDHSSVTTPIIKLFFLYSVAVSFPLMVFPARSAVYTLVVRPLLYGSTDDVTESDDYIPERPFRGITLILVFGTLLIAIGFPTVELVIGLSGSLLGSLIAFVIPGVLYPAVLERFGGPLGEKQGGSTTLKFLARCCAVVGVLVLVLCTFDTLRHAGAVESAPVAAAIAAETPETVMKTPDLPVVAPDPPVVEKSRLSPVYPVNPVPAQAVVPNPKVPDPPEANNNQQQADAVKVKKQSPADLVMKEVHAAADENKQKQP